MPLATVQVFVKGFKGGTTVVHLSSENAPIDDIFTEYGKKTGMNTDGLSIIFETKQLRMGTEKTLDDVGIKNESNVVVVFRLPGGQLIQIHQRYGKGRNTVT